MLNTRISVSIIGLLIGLAVFFISLIAAAEVSFGDEVAMSQRKLYFSKEILPDNILYPLVTGTDRVRLQLAGPEESVALQLQYAQERHQAAVDLVAKNENELALQTFKKSHTYLAQASSQAAELNQPPELDYYFTIVAKDQIKEMKQLRSQMTKAEEQSLNSIISEMEALLISFWDSLIWLTSPIYCEILIIQLKTKPQHVVVWTNSNHNLLDF